MGRNTKISWTNHTFNPWWGCTKVSPGCTHCYAETFDKRTGGDHWGAGKARRRTIPANWREPLRWNKAAGIYARHPDVYGSARPRVFCASMADWLDPEAPAEWLADLLALISYTPHLDWLLLTKRPELWRSRIEAVWKLYVDAGPVRVVEGRILVANWLQSTPIPPPNVWIGCTVEDQKRADERIPALLSIPARVRFLSCEPLLEAVDLTRGLSPFKELRPDLTPEPRIDWVIVGGESGAKARPFDLAWARSIRDQCREVGVPVFVKQMGSSPVGPKVWAQGGWCSSQAEGEGSYSKRLNDRSGADPAEWPEDLRVQQWPEVRHA